MRALWSQASFKLRSTTHLQHYNLLRYKIESLLQIEFYNSGKALNGTPLDNRRDVGIYLAKLFHKERGIFVEACQFEL